MKKKNILIIGSGGREHALGWKLHQSPEVAKLYFAPGNGGTAALGENVDIAIKDHTAVIDFVREHTIDLVVVAPDDPLAAGMVDDLQQAGIRAFGPIRKAAQVEWSKAFAKQLMQEEDIPTAKAATFTNFSAAKKYLLSQQLPIVIKASGLALGKGVTICQTHEEATEMLRDVMVKKIFGDAGNEVVIEEYLTGQEVSCHVFCDGETVVMFPASKDHKQVYDHNRGPNTGGMGTIAPVPQVTAELIEEVRETIVLPLLRGLKKRGVVYKGILYPGIMITKDGPKVLEFNARFGDPETQVYMRLLETDLLPILESCIDGTLSETRITWKREYACCIILASEGYPGAYKKGVPIVGVDTITDSSIQIFHAGTGITDNHPLTTGGRVLGVSATGKTLEETLEKAYAVIGDTGIHFPGMQLRHDIGRTD